MGYRRTLIRVNDMVNNTNFDQLCLRKNCLN